MDSKLKKNELLLLTQSTGFVKFYKEGAYIINRQIYFFFLTLILIVSSTIMHIYLLSTNFKDHFYFNLFLMCFSSVMGFITIISLILVTISNPGFYNVGSSDEDKENENIKKQNQFMRKCRTCQIIKDLRVFHCKFCNLCVERHGIYILSLDHHCPWLGNCVGEKNHRLFLTSIAFLYIHTIIIMSEEIYLTTLLYERKTSQMFEKISVMIILLLSSVTFLFLTCLLCNQLFFISKNITTSEYKRNKYGSGIYPFDKGAMNNIKQFFNSITDYKKDITHNFIASYYLSKTSLVFETENTKNDIQNTSEKNSLEMSFNTNKLQKL